MTKLSWDDINLREFREEDIAPYIHYWFHCPDSKHIHAHINREKFPTEDEFEKMMLDRAQGLVEFAAIVVEFKGKAIGIHNLTNMKDAVADFHAHFWDVESRGKGIAVISSIEAGKYFFNKYDLEYLYLKPPVDNKYSSRAMEKSGLSSVGQEVYDSPFIIENVLASIYKVHRDEMEGIEKKFRNLIG